MRKSRSIESYEQELKWLERGMWCCVAVAVAGMGIVIWSFLCEG